MNTSRIVTGAYDVLLEVTVVEGSPKADYLLGKQVVFEGVISDKPFFAGDSISLRYQEDFGSRRFNAEVLSNQHVTFVEEVSKIVPPYEI